MLMTGWQHESSGAPPQPGNLGRVQEADLGYEQYPGLPPLGDLLPIDTQLLSPSLARAFNLPTPAHLSHHTSSLAGPRQVSAPYGLQGSSPNPSARPATRPQASPQGPQTARPAKFSATQSAQELLPPSTYPPRTNAFGNMGDYGLQQQIQQQLQQYQQRGAEASRGTMLDHERMQHLANQYASYNQGQAVQPALRSPAAQYPPLNVQAAQAAMYGYQDSAPDAQAAAMAHFAGAAGYPGMSNSAHTAGNAGANGNPPGSQGVGDKRPAEPSSQRPPQAGHSGLHSGNGSDDATGLDERGARALKRPRLVWTPQLHQRFVDAVNQLGLKNAVPKTIMQLMSVDGLTRENVASHLQKYRLQLKRQPGDGSEDPGLLGATLDGNSDMRMDAPTGPSSVDEDGGLEAKGNQQVPAEMYQTPKAVAAHDMGRPLGPSSESRGFPPGMPHHPEM